MLMSYRFYLPPGKVVMCWLWNHDTTSGLIRVKHTFQLYSSPEKLAVCWGNWANTIVFFLSFSYWYVYLKLLHKTSFLVAQILHCGSWHCISHVKVGFGKILQISDEFLRVFSLPVAKRICLQYLWFPQSIIHFPTWNNYTKSYEYSEINALKWVEALPTAVARIIRRWKPSCQEIFRRNKLQYVSGTFHTFVFRSLTLSMLSKLNIFQKNFSVNISQFYP